MITEIKDLIISIRNLHELSESSFQQIRENLNSLERSEECEVGKYYVSVDFIGDSTFWNVLDKKDDKFIVLMVDFSGEDVSIKREITDGFANEFIYCYEISSELFEKALATAKQTLNL